MIVKFENVTVQFYEGQYTKGRKRINSFDDLYKYYWSLDLDPKDPERLATGINRRSETPVTFNDLLKYLPQYDRLYGLNRHFRARLIVASHYSKRSSSLQTFKLSDFLSENIILKGE